MMALHLGLALAPTWLRGDSWRRDDSRAEEIFSLAPYVELARAAESAGLDFLFVPDAGHLDPSVIDRSPGFSTLDSHTLTAALAAITHRIGVVPTVQTTFSAPYTAARQIQSLHRLSEGRAGWNVVTSLGGHDNFGIDEPPSSSERYERAREFVEVVRALWASYPGGSIVLDRENGRFADPDRVRSVGFRGEHFRVAGPLQVEAHASGDPVLFQAGGSPAGVAFAGETADAVFGMASDIETARAQREALRRAASAAGREPDAVRSLPGFSFVLAETRDEAESLAGGRSARGPAHWTVVGTPRDAVDAIESWSAAGAIDGLIALPGGSWRSIGLFLHEVVPALVDRGLARAGYAATTLRGHLGLDAG